MIGGIIGMVIWAGLIVLTETEIGWVAWGVGLLTGYSARLIGRGYSHEMGLAAALAALVAILAGQYLAVRHSINSFIEEAVTEGYDYDMVFAKEAVKQKTDPQIRVFLASQATEEGETMTPGEITAEDIQAFREEMPTYQKMAANQYSRAEYERENRAFFAEIFTTGFILKNTFSLWTILWIFLGVGSAWRLASGG